jgi:hypothetical protein
VVTQVGECTFHGADCRMRRFFSEVEPETQTTRCSSVEESVG